LYAEPVVGFVVNVFVLIELISLTLDSYAKFNTVLTVSLLKLTAHGY